MLSSRIDRLAPPPRPVPLRVACRAMLGMTGALGAIFLLVGTITAWVFVGDLNPLNELRLARSPATAQGIVTGVATTNASENDEPVYVCSFTFRTPDERTITGKSYVTGYAWSVEDRVTIEYVPEDPTVARIEGARLSQFSPFVLFVLIFPATGAVLFATSTVRGWKQAVLLRLGESAGSKIISERATGTRINDVPVMEYVYEFPAPDGESYIGKSRALPSGRIGDEATEPVLYLPQNPRRSTLVDALPLRYPLDVDGPSGQWISQERVWPVMWYTLIWIGIAANVAYAFIRMLANL
jgi:hypothetical protein